MFTLIVARFGNWYRSCFTDFTVKWVAGGEKIENTLNMFQDLTRHASCIFNVAYYRFMKFVHQMSSVQRSYSWQTNDPGVGRTGRIGQAWPRFVAARCSFLSRKHRSAKLTRLKIDKGTLTYRPPNRIEK